jgi:hypothetical protein
MDPPGGRFAYDDGDAAQRKQVAIAFLAEIQESPPGGSADASSRSIAIASADGRELTSIARSTQGLLGYHHARKDALFVFYVSSGIAKVIELDPVTRKIRSDGPLTAKE